MGRSKNRPKETRLDTPVESQASENDGLGHDIGCEKGEEADRSEKHLLKKNNYKINSKC